MISQKAKTRMMAIPGAKPKARQDIGEVALKGVRPNPDWAKLPLFDRKGWKKVLFGDIVENFNEPCDPVEAGIERFVGLEHLEPGTLHIRNWGNVRDGTTFTRRCRVGQVLFGKRRAYQRKVAVAEFEAVVSGDIYVFAAKKEKLIPELLPFLCLSENFYRFAVETSAGSLSPRTNWAQLSEYKVVLPPLEHQRRLAEIFWSYDAYIQHCLKAITTSENWLVTYVEKTCMNIEYPRFMLADTLSEIVAGKSVAGSNTPSKSNEYGVLKVSAVGPFGFESKENKRLVDFKDFLPKYSVGQNDFLITRCNTKELVGRVCIVPKEYPKLMLSDKTLKLIFNPRRVLQDWMLVVLQSRELRMQIEARATGTGGAMKNITQDGIKSLLVPCPSLAVQVDLLRQVNSVKSIMKSVEVAKNGAYRCRDAIINQLL